jgi:hypothetical protein
MDRINAEPHALNHMKRISLGRPSPSWTVLVASLATVGLGSVPIQVAHADQIYVDCKANKLIDAISSAISSAASGDFLSLTPGCIYTLTGVNNSDPNLGDNGLPVINITLTIKGNGATIARQQSTPTVPKFRIFQVAPGGDLTLSDLTVDNGDADSGSDTSANRFRKGRGGGVYNLGALKVINSTFSRNHASSGGGAIGNGDSTDFSDTPAAGDLTLSDGVLVDNKGDIGGAIASGLTSTMNLTGSTISHNTGVSQGGGVATQGKAILNKCTISGNKHTGAANVIGGGGIVNGGPLFLADSLVTGNTATQGGGIVNGGQLFLTHSPVTSNSANDGGGIVNGGQLFLTHSPVTGNSATGPVSAQSGFGGGILNAGSATATHSDIAGNSASNDGGGIENTPNAIATLTNSDVSGNSTTKDGGGIANGGHMTLTQSNVTGNNAGQNGGGIANKGGATLTLTHSDVTDNKAGQEQHGGGIFNQTGNTVTLNQSTVDGNTPDDCSGVPGC